MFCAPQTDHRPPTSHPLAHHSLATHPPLTRHSPTIPGGNADPNKKVLDTMVVEPDNADGHSLFCMVYTIKGKHSTAAATVRTVECHDLKLCIILIL